MTAPVSLATRRQQRLRERRRLGLLQLTIEVQETLLIDALITTGRLDEAAALDPDAVAEAASLVLFDFIHRWPQR